VSEVALTGRISSVARFRRSPHLIVYWQDDRLVARELISGRVVRAAPAVLGTLEFFSRWRTAGELARRLGAEDRTAVQSVMESLVRYGLLVSSEGNGASSPTLSNGWSEWGPEAALFHHATRNVSYAASVPAEARLRRKAARQLPPSPVKVTRGPRVRLPRPALQMDLCDTLRERRTWRRFGRRPVTREALATLLGLTWGIQQWVDLDGYGPTPLTTSPSPGARHSVEAYVLVRRIHDVPRGLYHYDADKHALVRMPCRRPKLPSDYLPTQTWYNGASALVFMASVFARAQWRYSDSRTYRSLLAEVGHQAQTFCLVATALGLAPFCSMALADSTIERDLGLDGVSEAVMYSVGVGARPHGVAWAPWSGTSRTPRRTLAKPFGGGRVL
jgi:SagB-type dehydrogenase family enzyme